MAEKKYFSQLQKEISRHIASGLNYKDPAYLAGIAESTLLRVKYNRAY
jgi:DNA-binding CsgD family transcriptional regulator